jgi:hypothetical protein
MEILGPLGPLFRDDRCPRLTPEEMTPGELVRAYKREFGELPPVPSAICRSDWDKWERLLVEALKSRQVDPD